MRIRLTVRLALVGMLPALSTALLPAANGQPSPLSLTLGLANANPALVQESTSTETATTTSESSSRHPAFITDLESKAWPGFLTGLPGYEDFVMPVGFPYYFEAPSSEPTSARCIFITTYRTGPCYAAARFKYCLCRFAWP